MGIEVFALWSRKKIRCQVLEEFGFHGDIACAIVVYPLLNKNDDHEQVIPILFDTNKSNQEAWLVTNAEEQIEIEKIVKRRYAKLLFKPLDRLSFDVEVPLDEFNRYYLKDEKLQRELDIKKIWDRTVNSDEENITNVERINRFLAKVPGSIQGKFENIASYEEEIINLIHDDNTAEAEYYWNLKRELEKPKVIRQAVFECFSDIIECNKYSENFYNYIVSRNDYKEALSEEDRNEIHNKLVLNHVGFFSISTLKKAADYYYDNKEFTRSITLLIEYQKKIPEKHTNIIAESFNMIGCCYINMLEFQNAYDSFEEANNKGNGYPTALNNWSFGLCNEAETVNNEKRRKVLLKEAIDKINEAIESGSGGVAEYKNKMYIEMLLGDYEACIESCKKLMDLSDENEDHKYALKISIQAKIKMCVESKEKELKFSDIQDDLLTLYNNETGNDKYFYEALKVVDEIRDKEDEQKVNEIAKALIILENNVETLMDSIAVHDPKQSVYFYTSMDGLRRIFMDESDSIKHRMPLFNVGHMDNPREGIEFGNLISYIVHPNVLADDLFNKSKIDKKTKRKQLGAEFVFLKSFTGNADSLPMWKNYADHGSGCCVKVSPYFFTNFTSDLNGDDYKSMSSGYFDNQYRLHYVLYVEGNRIINPGLEKAQEIFERIINSFTTVSKIYINLGKASKKSVLNAVGVITEKLKYLVKSSDYAYEQEMRIVVRRPISSLKRDDIDVQLTRPVGEYNIPRVYVNTVRSLPIDEIIFGPNVKGIRDIVPFFEKKLLEMNDFSAEKSILSKSKTEYR